ncbi:CRISPR-associated protein Cas5 [Actinomadura atramentaria]|uniref:CRISPR-associated protein Cas5 n=1 Tax=Actinomadura atramentaria TaxID=1990 RepID=UPI000364F37B|nr:CRISPR-associated protein Cas5 [Actinomadura atramentaria]
MSTDVLKVTITAPVVSFRNPLYAGVQVCLPCPPPATVGGMLAAVAGGWSRVDPAMRFAMAFRASGAGVDVETYHPLDGRGRSAEPTPRDREFLTGAVLTVWILDDPAVWEKRFRRPTWPLRIGRSQDLAGIGAIGRDVLSDAPGLQGAAIVPAELTLRGTLLRLPTAVSLRRDRTVWDAYRFDRSGRSDERLGLADSGGCAVVPLPSTHPDRAVP